MSDFASLFQTFTTRAFRYESLPAYSVQEEDEALNAYLNGEPFSLDWHDGWLSFIRDAANSHRELRRVRLISEPLGVYVKFEMQTGYPLSMNAGEDIRQLSAADLPQEYRDIPDFWLFDQSAVAIMRYDELGHFLGADVTTTPSDIERYSLVANRLVELSRPIDLSAVGQ